MNYCPFCGSSKIVKTTDYLECQSCQRTFYINSKPTACVIPAFENKMLLGIRKYEPGKGKMDILGGFLNNGETPEDGALREMKEESHMNLKKEDLNFLGIWVDEYLYQDQNYFTLNVLYYVLLSKEPGLTPGDDISELDWVNIDPNLNLAFPTQKKSVEKLIQILNYKHN